MMNYLSAAVSIVALAASMVGGYKIGTWRLESCRSDLAALEQTGKEAQQLSRDQQAQLVQKQAALEQEHQAKVAEMNQTFTTQRAAMETQLGQAMQRLKVSQGRSVSTNADLAKVQQQIDAAVASSNAPLLKKLREQQQALEATQAGLVRQQAGLVCLQASVPSEEVALLNRSVVFRAPAAPGAQP